MVLSFTAKMFKLLQAWRTPKELTFFYLDVDQCDVFINFLSIAYTQITTVDSI